MSSNHPRARAEGPRELGPRDGGRPPAGGPGGYGPQDGEDPDRHPDGTPRRLGRYRLLRPISTGGMARVFEARRESIAGVSPRVAIKLILPDFAGEDRFRDLFVNEARIGSLLQHQNLVQIQDFDCEDGVYYLVMEYVEGVTLRRCISTARRHGQELHPVVIAEVGRQVCEGLANAHTARRQDGAPLGLVHRDIKPSNLMINPQGVVKVLDFGISLARITEEREGAVRGTWGYMAPEQAAGQPVGPAADLFGLAAVLYEMVAQRPLFPEKSEDHIRELLAQDEAARRAAHIMGQAGPLGSILVRALQRDPAARYPSAAAMGRALGDLLPDPVTARDALTRFQEQIAELSEARPLPALPGRPEPVAPPRPVPSFSIDGPGLPVRVGSGPEAPPASLLPRPPAGGGLGRIFGLVGFLGLALAILGYTAWHVVRPPGPPAPAPVPAIPAAPAPADAQAGGAASDLSEYDEEPAPAEAPAQAPSSPPEAPAPAPAPRSAPAERPAPRSAPERPAPAAEPAAEATTGRLTVSSIPRAKVIVDGRFIRESPLFNHPVSTGPHSVTLIAPDGATHSFMVDVPGDGQVRRVWSFEANAFVGD